MTCGLNGKSATIGDVKGVKKVCSAMKLSSYFLVIMCLMTCHWNSFNTLDKKKKPTGCLIKYFFQAIKDLQNQVPFGFFFFFFLDPGAKWRIYDKETLTCNGDIVIRIFPNWLRNPKWSCYSSYIT